MITPEINKLLQKLTDQTRAGVLTPAKRIIEFTLVCFKEREPVNGGIIYRQQVFETLPKAIQEAFMFQQVGAQISQFKIVGIFDVWLPETPKTTKAKKPTKLSNSDF
jgi:hypothetical protein